MAGKLDGKAALVIGAGSGLGRASAEACAEDGAMVMVGDVNEANAKAVVDGIRAKGGQAEQVLSDVLREETIKAAVDATTSAFGRLDILVNCAGAAATATDAGWHLAIDLFLKGPYYACRHAVGEIAKQGGGSIINIGSIASVTGGWAESIEGSGYASGKHGLIGLTRTMALVYAKDNIRVNAVCPGYMRSEMTRQFQEADDGGMSLIRDRLRVPLGRWGEAHEIGRVVAFLASPDASFITGQPIIVDGGFMAR